MHTVKLKF